MNIRSLLGALQPQPDQFQTLLGEYYDPKAARMKWLGGTLQGLGAGLASGKPGAWAEGLAAGGGQALDDYKQQALLGYRMKQAADDKAYDRSRDAQSDAWREKQWDYTVGRDKVADQRWDKSFGIQQQQAAFAAEDQARQRKEWEAADANTAAWNTILGGITDPNERAWATADPKGYVESKYGNNKPPQVETFYDPTSGQPYKAQWDTGTRDWVPVGGRKSPENGVTITNPDGTVTQVGGNGQKLSADDKRAKALVEQIVGQEGELFAGFDALAKPSNYAGSRVPGGAAIMSPDAQVASDAITNTVANWLYLTSGATATDAEIERQTAMVTPSPMDSQQRVAAKKARLKSILDTMKSRGGIQVTEPPVIGGGAQPTIRVWNPTTGELE